MNSKEIQENVVKAVENCGLAIYKNAQKIINIKQVDYSIYLQR